jgi:hypothetical protein
LPISQSLAHSGLINDKDPCSERIAAALRIFILSLVSVSVLATNTHRNRKSAITLWSNSVSQASQPIRKLSARLGEELLVLGDKLSAQWPK